MLHRQIRQTQNIEKNRIRRRHAAARSTMPLALSSIMEYACGVGRELRRIHTEATADHVSSDVFANWQVPAFPQGDTGALGDVVENASEDIVHGISKLLVNLQVQASSVQYLEAGGVLGTVRRATIPKPEIEMYIRRSADIYARCEMLLEYARGDSVRVQPEPSIELISRALFIMGFHGALREGLMAKITERESTSGRERVPRLRRILNSIQGWWRTKRN